MHKLSMLTDLMVCINIENSGYNGLYFSKLHQLIWIIKPIFFFSKSNNVVDTVVIFTFSFFFSSKIVSGGLREQRSRRKVGDQILFGVSLNLYLTYLGMLAIEYSIFIYFFDKIEYSIFLMH